MSIKKVKYIKCYCSYCGHKTHHRVLYGHTVSSQNEYEGWWEQTYRVVQCCGCDHVSFNLESLDESSMRYDEIEQTHVLEPDYSSYPKAEHEVEPLDYAWDIPSPIYHVYHETIKAINQKAYCLAAAGFRMIIEAICVEKGITSRNLESKIYDLRKRGIITDADKNRLHSIRFMGNDSVHLSKVPSRENILLVLEIINGILFNLYVIENKVAGKLESPIKDYDEFEKLLKEGIASYEIGQTGTLRNLLPRNRRLIKEDISGFETQLKQRIEDGKFTNLALCAPPLDKCSQQYKVVEK